MGAEDGRDRRTKKPSRRVMSTVMSGRKKRRGFRPNTENHFNFVAVPAGFEPAFSP